MSWYCTAIDMWFHGQLDSFSLAKNWQGSTHSFWFWSVQPEALLAKRKFSCRASRTYLINVQKTGIVVSCFTYGEHLRLEYCPGRSIFICTWRATSITTLSLKRNTVTTLWFWKWHKLIFQVPVIPGLNHTFWPLYSCQDNTSFQGQIYK